MDIRRFWAILAEQTSSQRRLNGDRTRAIRKVLRQLRIRERALLDLQRSVADDEQREEISGKLSVLRAQREKGVSALREFRAERLALSRRRALRAASDASQKLSVISPFPERQP